MDNRCENVYVWGRGADNRCWYDKEENSDRCKDCNLHIRIWKFLAEHGFPKDECGTDEKNDYIVSVIFR